MGRNAEIEALFEAWYDRDHCLPPEKAAAQRKLNALVDGIVAKAGGRIYRDHVFNAFWAEYRDEYRPTRFKKEILGSTQISLGPVLPSDLQKKKTDHGR
jgi:hypothetical protein